MPTPTPSPEHLARTVEVMLDLDMCRTTEARLLAHGDGQARLGATATAVACRPSGQLPGTVLYTLLDYTAFLAVATTLGDDQTAATVDAHFTFLDAAPEGSELEITARLDRRGRHLAFLWTEAAWVSDAGRRLLATSRITKAISTYAHRFRDRATPGD